MLVVLGAGQQILLPPDKGLPPLRISSAQQLAGLLPQQIEAVQGTADRLPAAAPTKPPPPPAHQAAPGPAGRRVSPGSRRRRRGRLGRVGNPAEPGPDLGAKGGLPPPP